MKTKSWNLCRGLGAASLLMGLVANTAIAGNDGRGGDAIVCFKNGISGNITMGSAYRLTKEGRKNIETAETREGYRIRNLSKKSNFLASLDGKAEAEAFDLMLKRFESVPGFYKLLREMHERLDPIEDGFKALGGLVDIKDTGLKYELEDPEKCVFVQAVVREKATFSRDVDVYAKFSPIEKALMRLHEVVYAVGADVFMHETSGPTERVILHALGQDLSPAKLVQRLEENGFGKWMTMLAFEAEIEKVVFQPARHMRTYLSKVYAHFSKGASVKLSSPGVFLRAADGPARYESLFSAEESEAILDSLDLYPSLSRDFPVSIQKWSARLNCEAVPAKAMIEVGPDSSGGMGPLFGAPETASGDTSVTFGLDLQQGFLGFGSADSNVINLSRACPTKMIYLPRSPLVEAKLRGTLTREALTVLGLRVKAIDALLKSLPNAPLTPADLVKYENAQREKETERLRSLANPAASTSTSKEIAKEISNENAAMRSAETMKMLIEINNRLKILTGGK